MHFPWMPNLVPCQHPDTFPFPSTTSISKYTHHCRHAISYRRVHLVFPVTNTPSLHTSLCLHSTCPAPFSGLLPGCGWVRPALHLHLHGPLVLRHRQHGIPHIPISPGPCAFVCRGVEIKGRGSGTNRQSRSRSVVITRNTLYCICEM
jgi:hypothetical protein